MSDWMYYSLGSPKQGYKRILAYSTKGSFSCPDVNHDEYVDELKHNRSVVCGQFRKEVVSSENTSVTDTDGSTLITVTTVTRRWKVTKAGRKPTCRCGKEMVWDGWRVWLTDETRGDTIMGFRNATNDKHHWVKWAKTLKMRDQIISTALKNDRVKG